MKLLIDMGNSRLKAACYEEGKFHRFESVAYQGISAIECFRDYVSAQSGVVSLVLVSVLGEKFHEDAREYCEKHVITLIWAASEENAYGVKSKYIEPTSLGSDRFVALVGARKLFPNRYCIVVDCGTAVTVDALASDGVFCGGVIIPGLQLWGDSLTSRANQLKAHQLENPSVFARDTAQAIGSGSLFGLVGAIEGVCQRMEAQFKQANGADITVVRLLCGGDAELIAGHSLLTFDVQPHLVLTGLAEFTE